MRTLNPQRLTIGSMFLLALAGAAVSTVRAEVVWVDNESFALHGCAGNNEMPANEDPQALMRSLRERGLSDAAVRLSGRPADATLTPISATWRCDGAPSSVVFRLSTYDRNGNTTTSHLVSRVPTPVTPVASSR